MDSNERFSKKSAETKRILKDLHRVAHLQALERKFGSTLGVIKYVRLKQQHADFLGGVEWKS